MNVDITLPAVPDPVAGLVLLGGPIAVYYVNGFEPAIVLAIATLAASHVLEHHA